MAHTKAGGSTRQKGNRKGKHLGVKMFGGEHVEPGNILVRQKGTLVHKGLGVRMGKDFTLYAVKSGSARFSRRQGKQIISID